MDPDRAYERAELIKAFAHPTRLQILADVEELGVDLLSVAGHKVYAPKGIGRSTYGRE